MKTDLLKRVRRLLLKLSDLVSEFAQGAGYALSH